MPKLNADCRWERRLNRIGGRPGRVWGALALAAGLALCAGSSLAAGHHQADPRAAYQLEREACNRIADKDERATCLKEAAAAYGEARRDNLTSAPREQYRQNALDRCNAQPTHERDLCSKRLSRESEAAGSVEEGGIYRRIEIIVPGTESY